MPRPLESVKPSSCEGYLQANCLLVYRILFPQGQHGVTPYCPFAPKVNSNDNDGGILVGNWSGNYADGTSPLAWSGSGAILEQFWRTRKAVKYAQCWVFGGTLTTSEWVCKHFLPRVPCNATLHFAFVSVLRSLGIPSRPITNFASAHDTDANRAIDFYYDRNYDEISHMSADSIW